VNPSGATISPPPSSRPSLGDSRFDFGFENGLTAPEVVAARPCSYSSSSSGATRVAAMSSGAMARSSNASTSTLRGSRRTVARGLAALGPAALPGAA
jgi:hypothetical protein